MSDAIEAHLTETRTVAPPAEFAAHARLRDRGLWAQADAEGPDFWLRHAREQITWFAEPTVALDDANPPF